MTPDDTRHISLCLLQGACAVFCLWIAWTLMTNPKPPKHP